MKLRPEEYVGAQLEKLRREAQKYFVDCSLSVFWLKAPDLADHLVHKIPG